ncbi:gamma-tubulin complex, DGRIP91/SPC98 component protein [Lentinula aciculospora]|uniref:Spindle pole body component n=1 Tax=Lentinula aciculospora TaxID=153920 RepID=A0A9W9AIN7_9AGAR|nr:gamma-tubulin complex, DGRIP91/SPC98 component protein [Lentinula aciculospora]
MIVFPPVESDEQVSLPPLPPINARFVVPRFVEKPQDPIMDTLKLNASNSSSGDSHFRLDHMPQEISLIYKKQLAPELHPSKESIWQEALKFDVRGRSSQVHCWDNLRSNASTLPSSSGFLSEQDGVVFAAAHHWALPILQDTQSVVQYMSLQDLLKNMKLTVLGFSSLLHEWDILEEQFFDIGLSREMRKRLIIEGKDEIISSNFISRFIQIGASLRRLETLVEQLRSKSNIGPTMYAFVHALSTCLAQIRRSLASGPPSEEQLSTNCLTLNSIFMYYDQHQGILTALSSMCKRQGEGLSPKDYEPMPSSPHALLSLIYNHLHDHIEYQSPHHVKATLAFILTSASSEYFKEVSGSIGFGSEGSSGNSGLSREYPTFFPSELIDALPVAQKSLKLLRVAQPNHPILKDSRYFSDIQWFWTPKEILSAVNSSEEGSKNIVSPVKVEDQPLSSSSTYLPELAEFQIFDLEPGNLNGQSCFDMTYTSAPRLALDAFIKGFPSSFPPITPTLTHITSLVLNPLLLHATTLSTTLLSIFVALPPPLNIHSHLRLLRSYILLMSPSFKRRLSAALFSDSGNFEESPTAFSLGSLRHGVQRTDLRRKTWAVGLAPALLERATWPPMDTDLSFFLRTVIWDSFEDSVNEEARRSRVEEIENRLGFAVRDLSHQTGHSAWSNPLRIEALDFLYMEYKPPQPLDVVITPDILSKYQRVFSFHLRILRVQHAIHAVLRMSSSTSPFVFGTLSSSRKMLLHFRFIAQSFVSNLVAYVYDTAIAGNLDPFLARLKKTGMSSGMMYTEYPDVFSLAEAHSAVMDAILTACLLRSGQRIAGGMLRDALELVLDFTVLVGDLYRGRIEEYQAASVLEDLYIRFQKKMASLFEVLSSTVDKSVSLRASIEVPHPAGKDTRNTVGGIGGIEALSHLLIHLDLGEFWLRAGDRKTQTM